MDGEFLSPMSIRATRTLKPESTTGGDYFATHIRQLVSHDHPAYRTGNYGALVTEKATNQRDPDIRDNETTYDSHPRTRD